MSTNQRDESSLGDDRPDLVDDLTDSYADTADLGTVQVHDETDEDPNPDDFSLDDFLAGARPALRSIRLFMRPDLIADLDELAATIDRLPDDDDRLPDLVQRFNDTRDAFYASGRRFVVQSRSGEWIEKVNRDMAHARGFKVREDGTLSNGNGNDAAARRSQALQDITCELLARQIVSPAGVTAAKLAELAELLPTEFAKLLAAQGVANRAQAQNAKVLSADFSRGSSAATPSS